MECIILAGGKGTRLGQGAPPKALIKVGDRTILDHRLQYLIKQGIKRFVIAVGYKKEEVKEHVRCYYNGKAKIFFSEEDNLLGTAGAIKNAMRYVEGKGAFVTNVDDITNIDIQAFKGVSKGENTICLARFRSPYGIVKTEKGMVYDFVEKPLLTDLWASCGFYYLRRETDLPEEGSIEEEVFPYIPLRVYKHQGYWYTVNTLKDKIMVEEKIKEELLE